MFKATAAGATAAGAAAAGPRPDGGIRWAMTGLSLSTLMPALDISIANVGLPALTRSFAASFQEIQWVVIAYLLATTALIVSAGRLADILGRRRLLLAGIALFTLASLFCGIAPSLELLLAGRALQGLGAAAMLALSIAFVGEIVPKSRTGRAMGLLGTMSAIGTTLGPSLGGVLIAAFGWRAIFLVNLPIGIVNLLLVLRALPADRPPSSVERPRLDIAGTLLLSASLAAYALAMTLGHGSFTPLNLALLGAALAGAIAFVAVESRVASPLLRLAMFAEAGLTTGLAGSLVVSAVIMSTLVVGPFYLSHALGLDAAATGLVMSAGPLVAAFSGVPAGRLVDRFGAARMTFAGLGGMTLGLLSLALLSPAYGAAGYVMALALVTAHYALFQAANNTAIMAGAPAERRGVISGMLSLSRNLGLITGASLMGAVFAVASGGSVVAASAPAIAGGMRATFLVAAFLVAAIAIITAGIRSVRRIA